jgi:hypothetical protein
VGGEYFYAYSIEWERTVFPNALGNTVAIPMISQN